MSDRPPGIVIAHSPASSRAYIGSPSIAVLPDGDYVASHDFFGPGSSNSETLVYRSSDRGASWRQCARLLGQWWSTLFVHHGNLHILGTTTEYGRCVIRRSSDGGKTWTEPRDKSTGLLIDHARCHCGPTPVTEHHGRLWRGMESMAEPIHWPNNFQALAMSVDCDADLLSADSWTRTNELARDPTWLGGRFNGWLEGNLVAAPDGSLANILRVDSPNLGQVAALAAISDDIASLAFDPADGFIEFPGGHTKFTIRFDAPSGIYWALVNPAGSDDERNVLAISSSPDLRQWQVRSVVLRHPDRRFHAFQYVDWQIDGDDMIAVSRTAYDDGLGGAHSFHDANYLTFHRIPTFRDRAPGDPPLG